MMVLPGIKKYKLKVNISIYDSNDKFYIRYAPGVCRAIINM